MLDLVRTEIESRIKALEKYLKLCEFCDEVLSSKHGEVYDRLSAAIGTVDIPLEEKILRHCTVVVQAYGVFEWCVGQALSAWVTGLPKYKTLSNFPKPFQKKYRKGVARIVGEIEKRRFKDHDLCLVVESYGKALKEEDGWELISDALVFHQNNLRKEDLQELFCAVSLDDFWSYLENDKNIIEFLENSGNDENLEQSILSLVDYRNDAAHRRPDEILSLDNLRSKIKFVEIISASIVDFIKIKSVFYIKYNDTSVIKGCVIDSYRDNVVVVSCSDCVLKVGERVFFCTNEKMWETEILSIQIDDISKNEVKCGQEAVEIGMKLSMKVSKNSNLILLN